MSGRLANYFDTLFKATLGAECTTSAGERVSLEAAFDRISQMCHDAHDSGNKIMFIGNGGSMGIATHMAIDFSKNGKMRATAFGDGAVLTCLGNDLGYENVFAHQVDWHARPGDVLIAISSSGQSANILNGVAKARERGSQVITFSGFRDDNPLRSRGDVNLYVRSMEYGFVEVAHQALIHAVLDLDLGWQPVRQAAE